MSTVIYFIAAMVAVSALYFLLPVLASTYLKFRGTRVITCPETEEHAAVKVNAKHASITAILGDPDLRIKDCSRWPEHKDCGQECIKQIEASPIDCLVRTIVTNWYEGKTCVYCRKDIGELDWMERRPAIMSPEGKTVQWHEVKPEMLPEVFATHKPVCWNCHIAETFRREHPELVIDNPWKSSPVNRTI